ncbi:hypothetical protein HAX54_048397 [Datura stramonium]|uniref:NB-ARC domain-containing protein n=1 Tax=Datura stramonium TaxID=4076 RepID=A0ABS8WJB0_DATST|nr:hypothetical protein [Datura stramonium]
MGHQDGPSLKVYVLFPNRQQFMDTFIDMVVDFGVKKFKSISDFDENSKTLERNVKLLSDKAFDVKTEVENQERSRKKKRKREVESWFWMIMSRASVYMLGGRLGVEVCRLILTTRLHKVCQKMSCKKLLKVKKLNTDDAWELFWKSLGCETVLSPYIEPIAITMAGRCEGLPL